MKKYVFATNNKHKLHEVSELLKDIAEVYSLADMSLEGEIPETSDTLEGNSLQKVRWVWDCLASDGRLSSVDGCFADDTGLEVAVLGGAPGVYSARYAGEHCSFDDNIDKLLSAMNGETDRHACFRTVICLMEGDQRQPTTRYFEGRVDGTILTERYGKGGFGYDPVFMPNRFAVSFAEMPLEVKNQISHRGLAVKKLVEAIKQ